jgi:hypothetical protein
MDNPEINRLGLGNKSEIQLVIPKEDRHVELTDP